MSFNMDSQLKLFSQTSVVDWSSATLVGILRMYQ